jgi:hypothetical protein
VVKDAIAAVTLLSSSPPHRVTLLEIYLTMSSVCPVGSRSRHHRPRTRETVGVERDRDLTGSPLHASPRSGPAAQDTVATLPQSSTTSLDHDRRPLLVTAARSWRSQVSLAARLRFVDEDDDSAYRFSALVIWAGPMLPGLLRSSPSLIFFSVNQLLFLITTASL